MATDISGNFDVCPVGTLAELERLRDENIKLKLTLAHAGQALDWMVTANGEVSMKMRQEISEALAWEKR